MPRLPRVTASKTIKALERLGFVKVRQKGSHIKMRKQLGDGANSKLSCVVPLHKKNSSNRYSQKYLESGKCFSR